MCMPHHLLQDREANARARHIRTKGVAESVCVGHCDDALQSPMSKQASQSSLGHRVPTALSLHDQEKHRCLTTGRSLQAEVIANGLEKKDLRIEELQPSNVESFVRRPLKKLLKRSTRNHRRVRLNIYLDWLYSSGHLSFDPQCFRHKPKRLSQIPENFLESLTTIKSSSRRGYKSTLSVFHDWLEDNGLAVTSLKRQHMTRWFNYLKDKGLHPATRLQRILCVRVYLRWLYEQGSLKNIPEELVRCSDLPRLPSYLPRPLPPEADHELRLRLAGSECPYQQGLLLMRNTGLRVGELMSLELNCVRADHKGNRFLKVPLGKLDNERLVPIDDETFNLIGKLQRRGRRKKRWLLESPTRKKTQYVKYTRALHNACQDLEIPDRMTTHRLRHTYATSLLNGGMSLVGVMRLLGHRDYRMTLRYAAITQETIVKEYYEALVQTEKKYSIASRSPKYEELDPPRMLSYITRWLDKTGGQDPSTKRATRSLIRRIKRIQTAIQDLMMRSP